MAGPIDQGEVDQAANALFKAGERPTIEKVRRNIGRGSPNTISKMLDIWWKHASEGRLNQETVDPRELAIRQLVSKMFVGLVEEAGEAATADIKAAQAKLLEDNKKLDADRAAFEQDKLALFEDNSSLSQQLAAITGQLADANDRNQQLQTAIDVERTNAAEARGAAQAASDERERAATKAAADMHQLRRESQENQVHWIEQARLAQKRVEELEEAQATHESQMGEMNNLRLEEREGRIKAEAALATYEQNNRRRQKGPKYKTGAFRTR